MLLKFIMTAWCQRQLLSDIYTVKSFLISGKASDNNSQLRNRPRSLNLQVVNTEGSYDSLVGGHTGELYTNTNNSRNI
jgi:hypothetical protein